MIASKEITEETYWTWAQKYSVAATSMNREKEMEKVAD